MHVEVSMFLCTVRIVCVHLSCSNFMSYHLALVLAVMVRVTECPKIHHMGGREEEQL